jgi:hypothetical protein
LNNSKSKLKMAALKCQTRDVLQHGLQLFVMATAFTVFITLIGAYKKISWDIDCNPLNPNLPYPIFNTDCIAYNGTQVLVQIINCKDLKDVGFLISPNNKTSFKTTQSCWYSSGDVNCTMLTSNTLKMSNMTVSYSLPVEVKMWNSYEACLRNKQYLSDYADGCWAGAGVALGLFILFTVFILIYHCENPCKKKNQGGQDDNELRVPRAEPV